MLSNFMHRGKAMVFRISQFWWCLLLRKERAASVRAKDLLPQNQTSGNKKLRTESLTPNQCLHTSVYYGIRVVIIDGAASLLPSD